MYHPLGVHFLQTWNVPWIQPDERVAASATEEARKVKRDIARRHLASLCHHEEELLKLVDRDVVRDIYSQLGLEMPTPMPVPGQAEEGENSKCIDVLGGHDADYETVLLARSRFHPDQKVREEAVTSLALLGRQDMEEWKTTAADWGATAADCGVISTEETPTNSGDNLDIDSDWVDNQEQQCQWQDSALPENEDETESQQSIGCEEDQVADDELSACFVRERHPDLPTPPPSEMFSAPSSPTSSLRNDALPDMATHCAIEELTTVLNDKKVLTIYLASIDEGIRRVRKTKAEKDADKEMASQLYARPVQRERRQGPAGEEALSWFEYEKMHLYDDASGMWQLTVERRGRDYLLARASDPETLSPTKRPSKTPAADNMDWNMGAAPAWAGVSSSGWFDKES